MKPSRDIGKKRRARTARASLALRSTSGYWALAIGLLAFAFAVRAVYIAEYSKSIFFSYPTIDGATYDRMAWDFAQGRPLWKGAFWQPPLYPLFLGVIYKLIGHSLLAVRLVQALMGSISCALLYLIGRRIFTNRVGVLAAIIMALYGPLIYFDAELIPTSLYVFLLLSSLLLLLRVTSERWTSASFTAGIVCGLAVLARPDVALFVTFAAGWILWVISGSRRVKLGSAALVLLGTGLAVLPVTIRNYTVAHDLVLVSYNGGLNFYLGNNSEARKTVAIRPGFAWDSLMNELDVAGIKKPSARSRYYFEKGLSFLRNNPAAALRLYAEKFAHLWNSFEIGRTRDVYSTRSDSRLLSVLLWRAGPFGFPFGLLGPLACAGLVAGFSFDRRRVLLYLFLIAFTIAVVLFLVASRFRVPMIPVLILFAARYILWLGEHLRRRCLRTIVLSLVPLALSFLAVNRGYSALDLVYRGERDRFLGVYYTDRGQHSEAEEAYRRAIAADSGYAEAHAELGQLLQLEGRHDETLRHLRRANELYPSSEQTHYLLGTAYVALGDTLEAERCFRKSIAIAPNARAYRDLGLLMLEQERLDEAEGLFLAALRADPNDLNAWYKLGHCYFLQGRYSNAERALSEALRLAPGDSEIREKIERLKAIRIKRELRP